jgi:hypothetical protein
MRQLGRLQIFRNVAVLFIVLSVIPRHESGEGDFATFRILEHDLQHFTKGHQKSSRSYIQY